VVFYGPPGTGKTLAANLLGKRFGKEVFIVDAGKVVSKYIGETEKNLSAVFRKAASEDLIIYFDEAEALFGKRSEVKDAHDRYANVEVSYLLQLIDEYPGIVIISASSKQAIDEAFMRRLRSIVRFPFPTSG
jgi:SpoVK/Ycf46/Vps4 family AAA+-type ATPase